MLMAEIAYQLGKRWVLNLAVGGSMGGVTGAANAAGDIFSSTVSAATSGIAGIGTAISAGASAFKLGVGMFKTATGDFISAASTRLGAAAGAEFGAGFAGKALGTAYIGGAGTAIGGTGMAAGATTMVGEASSAAMMGVRMAELLARAGTGKARVGSFAATPAVESVGLSDALAKAMRG